VKYSIITPTHSKENIPYLTNLYASILAQTYINWEWVLYLNNGITIKDLPEVFMQNREQVRIFEQKEENTNIGYIKNKAFNLATGFILVEVDHDDMLAVNCLEELHKVFSKKPDVGFVYSTSIFLPENNITLPYREDYGWTYKTYNYKNQERISMNWFQPTSHSLSYIWYAPDHVRAWRTKVYKTIGGHDKRLNVCDDHELLIRTYLNTTMEYIDKPLYVYRITDNNTWKLRNKSIQETTNRLFDANAIKLAERDSEKQNLMNIDLGGGLNPYKDYKTIDSRNIANYSVDLNDGIPLETNSVGIVRAHHILEHLKDPIQIMGEIHRVLAPGGWAFIEVPSTDGRGAWQDPTHISYWNQNSFFYYTRKEQATFINNKTIKFQVYKLDTYFPNNFHKDNNIPITRAVLVAIKNNDIRYPGPLLI
jgi:glycosyltransferase involved in cell wall biosynthesis